MLRKRICKLLVGVIALLQLCTTSVKADTLHGRDVPRLREINRGDYSEEVRTTSFATYESWFYFGTEFKHETTYDTESKTVELKVYLSNKKNKRTKVFIEGFSERAEKYIQAILKDDCYTEDVREIKVTLLDGENILYYTDNLVDLIHQSTIQIIKL